MRSLTEVKPVSRATRLDVLFGPAQSRGESRLGHTSRLDICRVRNKVTAIAHSARFY